MSEATEQVVDISKLPRPEMGTLVESRKEFLDDLVQLMREAVDDDKEWRTLSNILRDELRMTDAELEDAERRLPEIEQSAMKRLVSLMEETGVSLNE